MISTFRTFSIDKAFYTSLKKYSQVIGTSLALFMVATFLSIILYGGIGISVYGLYQLLLAYKVGTMLWTTVAALKAFLFIASAIGFCLGCGALVAGIAKASLDLFRTGTGQIGTLFSCYDNAVHVALAILLVGIAVFLGLFFLIIPSLFIFCRTILTLYFIVDQGMTATRAIKASWYATRGNVLKIIGVFLILGIISSSFYVLAMPLSWFLFAYMYEVLSGRNLKLVEKNFVQE